MQKIEWEPSYSVGAEVLDAHHRHLAGLINRLAEHLGTPSNAVAVDDLLSDLTAYAADHFREEERVLAQCRYPDLGTQHADHQHFCEMLSEIRYGATLGLVDLGQLFSFLTRWWWHHILQEDMKYRRFVMGTIPA